MMIILEEIILDKDKESADHQAHSQWYRGKLSSAVCTKFGWNHSKCCLNLKELSS